MKRKIFILIMVACFAAVSFGQRRPRSVIQKIIQLTKPDTSGKTTFEQALSKLRNVYRFTGQSIDRSVIGQLAWAGLGYRIVPEMEQVNPQPLQSPFPIQLFFITNEGVFFYQPINNSLEQIMEGDVRLSLASSTAMPDSITSAGCVIVVTSSVTRNATARRGAAANSDTTRTAMLIDAGRIAQNIQLQTACLGQEYGSAAINDFDSRAVARICGLPRDYGDVLNLVCVGYLTEIDKEGSPGSSSSQTPRTAAIIVPGENFDDAEFYNTLRMLDSASIRVTVASNRLGLIKGTDPSASPFDVRVPLDQISAQNYDAIIIIGGPGAAVLINNPAVLNLVRDAFAQRKYIGAAAEAVAVLAQSGILRSGIKVTCPPAAALNIAQSGAIVTGQLVENDSRIITCIGPQGAENFARKITDAILGK